MADTFWNFSLKVYAAPGVGDECLALQDGYGIDVNLLLFAAFLGSKGCTLSIGEIVEVAELVRDWHEQAVKPLRGVRRAMKQMLGSGPGKAPDSVAALRTKIKAVELKAEKIEQGWLSDWASNRAPHQTIAGAESTVQTNIQLFLNACNAGNAPAPERLIAATLAQRVGLK